MIQIHKIFTRVGTVGGKKAIQILFKHDIFPVGGGSGGRGSTSGKFTVGSSLESSLFAQTDVH